MTLDGLEKLLRSTFRRQKVNMVRYADDFVISGAISTPGRRSQTPGGTFLKERGLELSPEKTLITHIEEGFDFLGRNIRKYDGKFLIKPAQKNMKAFLQKVRATIKAHKQIFAGDLIDILNPMIRGWATYHRHQVGKQTFNKVDQAVFWALWQWARRRHPNKPKRWVGRNTSRVCSRNWVFTGHITDKEGSVQQRWLFSAAYMPIKRHTKIKAEANPYDPAWEPYFEERLGVKMVNSLLGRRKILRLWKQQDGICPVCQQKITKATRWTNRHIVRKSKGGKDSVENLCCSIQIAISKFIAKR